MGKEELKKRLDEKVKVLKSQCKDAHFAEELISDVLSLKGQLSVEPTLLTVSGNVVSEIKESAYSITKYDDNKIVFAINGFKVIISPHLNVYEFPFNTLLTAHDNYDKLTEEEKQSYGDLLTNVCIFMQLPTFVFADPQLFAKFLDIYIPYLNDKMEETVNDELPQDNEAKNEQFKEEVEFKEQLKQELDVRSKND